MTHDEIKTVVRETVTAIKGDDNPEKLYTFTEAAKLMGVAYTTIRRWIDRGNIIPTADGRYISRRAINLYLTGAGS